ncbi:GNAT family N-acetyltransferase [Tenacibaculum sp. 190524A02b]|uniref:GNAT family N-acetyltransferase n=1 Tax=Tenacibaculum vairaonense TaxID=3137860 RepID=UPI0031FACA8B
MQITSNIALKKITNQDCEVLYTVMKEVYPLAYKHFWKDEGVWYLESQYSKKNIEKELLEDNATYYFILFNGEKIGNLRILWNKQLSGLEDKKTLKLHRIYLHSKVQGQGVGKAVLKWLEKEALRKQYELIWLDVMNEQPQAFNFYKKLGYQYHSHCFLDFELLHDEVRKMSQVYKKLS